MLIEKFKKEGLALSKNAMRQITGGYGGTCGYKFTTYEGITFISCVATYQEAQYFYNTQGGNWCCDSCYLSSYCGN